MPSIKHAREEFICLADSIYFIEDTDEEKIKELIFLIQEAFVQIKATKIPNNAVNSFAKEIAEKYLGPIISQVVQLDSRSNSKLESSLNKCMAEAAASLAEGFLGDQESAAREQSLANNSFFKSSSSFSTESLSTDGTSSVYSCSEDEALQSVLLESCALGAICK